MYNEKKKMIFVVQGEGRGHLTYKISNEADA